MSRSTALHLATVAAAPASPEHRRFKTLLEKIEQAQARLQRWQTELPLFAQMHDRQAAPELKKLQAAQRALAFETEQVLLSGKWGQADRQTLQQMICDSVAGLLDAFDTPDDELKALYNRHAEVDLETENQRHLDAMKGMVEKMGGIDLGDDPVASVEELMRRAQARMHEQQEQQDQARAHKKPRPAKKSAAQKRAEEAQARISQSVREVYRKLASALHPDRASNLPAAERDERTVLMQRANSAYEAGDLLALLQLQLQIEQVDIAQAAGIASEQVKHFNKVLAEQLREIEAGVDARQAAFCESYGLQTERRLDPATLGKLLKDKVRGLIAAQARVEWDRRLLRGDPVGIKRFLKQVREEQRQADADGLFF